MRQSLYGKDAGATRGFSLVEAMVAMILLTIIVLTLVGAIPTAHALTAQNSVRVQAVAAGQEYLDIIRQYVKASGVDSVLPPPPNVLVDFGNGFVSGQRQASTTAFVMTPSCKTRSLFSFDCTVAVTWTVNGGPQQKVDVESYVTSQAGF
jgi:type II secretory pathway pseudopilin PulG